MRCNDRWWQLHEPCKCAQHNLRQQENRQEQHRYQYLPLFACPDQYADHQRNDQHADYRSGIAVELFEQYMYPCWIKRFSKAERPVGTTQTRVGDTHCTSECNQKIGKSNRHPCDATYYFHRNPVSFLENTDLRLFSLTLLIPPLQKKVPALQVPEQEGTAPRGQHESQLLFDCASDQTCPTL